VRNIEYFFYKIRVIFVFVMIALVFGAMSFQLLKPFELRVSDRMYQEPSETNSRIKIIGIDQKSIDVLGPYAQWDRNVFAKLINKLNENPDRRPEVIGMDILFSGTSDSFGDDNLVQAVKEGDNVVIASKLQIDSRVVGINQITGYLVKDYIKEQVYAYRGLRNVAEAGFTNMVLDDDGVVRRMYTRMESDGMQYKSFPYLIAEKVVDNPGKIMVIPTMAEIQYSGLPGNYEVVSLCDVLNGTIPGFYFEDCIVLVGPYHDGMMDSYAVPITPSGHMYGVECYANAVDAFLDNKIVYSVELWIEILFACLTVLLFGRTLINKDLRVGLGVMAGIVIIYPILVKLLYSFTSFRLTILYIPVGVIIEFLAIALIRYIELQKKRADEMQNMLFSMADALAEAIEGRTPYNANHTKNVAKRCMEMVDYINKKHKEKKTDMHFSKKDRSQLYLAAMLHDIGKMDVPLAIMDKPTKLGGHEDRLRARLESIKLRLQNDVLIGRITKDNGDARMSEINRFLQNLGRYNSGQPLSVEDWKFIDTFCESKYLSVEGEIIHYLTAEEIYSLHISAGTLTDEEREIMQSHVVHTDKILQHMQFGEDFANVRMMAANHHELLNSQGYPNKIGGEQIDMLTRILTIVDIFDSLVADDRPYKKAKPLKEAFNILDQEAMKGKIDFELLRIAKEIWLYE